MSGSCVCRGTRQSRNRLRSAVDLAPLEDLHAELAAVRTQIERTDRLIDQVVYRLYGLTEEEIAVVEKSA